MTPPRLQKFYLTMFDDENLFNVRGCCYVHARRCESFKRLEDVTYVSECHMWCALVALQVRHITDIGENPPVWFEEDVIVAMYNEGEVSVKDLHTSLKQLLTAAVPTVRISPCLGHCCVVGLVLEPPVCMRF